MLKPCLPYIECLIPRFMLRLAMFAAVLVITTCMSNPGVSGQTGTTGPSSPLVLRVGSYNIHATTVVPALKNIAGEIRELNLDIVGLQECDVNMPRTQFHNIPKELAKYSGLVHHAFGDSIKFDGGLYGNAIISAYPILSTKRTYLPSGSGERRSLMHCVISVEGIKINVFNTHLSINSEGGTALRPEQFKVIQEIISQHRPFILFGDFNENIRASTSGYELLENVIMANTHENPLGTLKRLGAIGDGSGRAVDNIIISDDLTMRGVNVSRTTFSDHDMVYCEVAFDF